MREPMGIKYIEPKEWVKAWDVASREMDRLRRENLKQMDTKTAILNLLPAFEYAAKNSPLRESSGLVEQQRYFKRGLRKTE